MSPTVTAEPVGVYPYILLTYVRKKTSNISQTVLLWRCLKILYDTKESTQDLCLGSKYTVYVSFANEIKIKKHELFSENFRVNQEIS